MSNLADIPLLVERILNEALKRGASDIHVEPGRETWEVRYRIDGLLQTAETLPTALGQGVVTRLMVMAEMLTYRLDVPQEGRARFQPAMAVASGGLPVAREGSTGTWQPSTGNLELRVAVMPTTQGMRAAVRLPAELLQPRTLGELGLPAGVLEGLHRFAAADAGMLLLSGPAGSGKTTTIYALLSHIVQSSAGLSVIALEDPVERHLPGVTQIEVSPFGQLTYELALRSILRQDPQVLMLGEIRDAATASLAIQAALSGHRLISTLHAGTPGGAIARLFEMGIEPYQITSALFGVVSQRLLRRKADNGYAGRVPVAEMATMDSPLRAGILRLADSDELQKSIAGQPAYVSLRQAAHELVRQGITDEPEVRRVLGDGG